MLHKYELIVGPNKFRLKPGIIEVPDDGETTTTTEGFGTTTTEGFGTTTTTTEGFEATTTTTEGINPQYVYYDDGITEWRKGVRDGCFIWDRALTATSFDGIEDTDWENVDMLCAGFTTTTTETI